MIRLSKYINLLRIRGSLENRGGPRAHSPIFRKIITKWILCNLYMNKKPPAPDRNRWSGVPFLRGYEPKNIRLLSVFESIRLPEGLWIQAGAARLGGEASWRAFVCCRVGGQEEVLIQAGAARLGGEVAPLVARQSLSVETDSGRCS